jgi:hypothetical protein
VDQQLVDARRLGLLGEAQAGVAPHVGRAEQPLQIGVLLELLRERHDQPVLGGVRPVTFGQGHITAA